MKTIVVDLLAREYGRRIVTVDVIGAGPRAVAGILEKLGYRVDIYPFEAIAKDPHILGKYDLLLASAMTCDEPAARKLAALWDKYSYGIKLLGGPISAGYQRLARLGYDYIVYGEAEVVLPSLLDSIRKGLKPYNVKGVAFTDNGRLVFTGKPRYAERSELAYKHSTRIEMYEAYWAARVYVEIVRGCSNYRRPVRASRGRKCINCGICRHGSLEARLHCPARIPPGCGYCSVPELYGPARSRPLNIIVEEVRELVRKGVTRIVLSAPDVLDYGRDFLVDPKPLTDPCNPPPNIEALKQLFDRLYEAVPEFSTRDAYLMIENVKACLVTDDVASLFSKYLKGTPVHIGVESGDDRLLELMGRPSTTSDARRAVKLLSSAGLQPYVYFIYGLPDETPEAAEKTIQLMEELYQLGAVKVTAYRFRPLPGTAYEDEKPVVTEASKLIARKAEQINRRAKYSYLNTTVNAIVVGYHPAKRMLVAYMLPHGPVVLVRGPRTLVGWLVEVKVVDVVSDRMLEGVVVRRVRRVAPPREAPGRQS